MGCGHLYCSCYENAYAAGLADGFRLGYSVGYAHGYRAGYVGGYLDGVTRQPPVPAYRLDIERGLLDRTISLPSLASPARLF